MHGIPSAYANARDPLPDNRGKTQARTNVCSIGTAPPAMVGRAKALGQRPLRSFRLPPISNG